MLVNMKVLAHVCSRHRHTLSFDFIMVGGADNVIKI